MVYVNSIGKTIKECKLIVSSTPFKLLILHWISTGIIFVVRVWDDLNAFKTDGFHPLFASTNHIIPSSVASITRGTKVWQWPLISKTIYYWDVEETWHIYKWQGMKLRKHPVCEYSRVWQNYNFAHRSDTIKT